MLRLYHRPKSGRPVRAVWMLEEAGASYEVVRLSMDETRAPDHLARHPLGRVPVLEDADGVLFESAAVCLQIADATPEADLIPPVGSRERALVYQWVLYAMTEIESGFLPLLRGETSDEAKALLHERLAPIERVLEEHEYLVGDAFTVADLTAAAVMTAIIRPQQFSYALPEPWPQELVAIRSSVADRAGFKWVLDIYERHRGTSSEITRP